MFVGGKEEHQPINATVGDNSLVGQIGNGAVNAPVTMTATQAPPGAPAVPSEAEQGVVFERGEGAEKIRMVLPPTPETFAFLRERLELGKGE